MLVNIIIFVFGLIIGSFLNVCIWRLPRGQSIFFPASHCPKCKTPIKWYDNIPLISFLILRGQCRKCGAPISWRYPLIELSTAGLFLTASLIRPEAYFDLFFISALIVAFFSDLETGIIPDEIAYLGIPLGLLSAAMIGRVGDAAIGVALGLGLLLAVQRLGEFIYKKEALGGGDIKLAMLFGAFLGWQYLLLALFLGYLFGALEAVALLSLKLKKTGDYIAFGPALCLGALVALYWGQPIIEWYLSR